jgi:hypothetical protein
MLRDPLLAAQRVNQFANGLRTHNASFMQHYEPATPPTMPESSGAVCETKPITDREDSEDGKDAT